MAESRIEILTAWAENLKHRIIKEMEVQQITPYNPRTRKRDYKTKGELKASIDKKIWNASGGNPEMITFFYSYTGLFVETGTGEGQKYNSSKFTSSFKSGKKYYNRKQPGEREPKPFAQVIIKQRAFSLGHIAARALAEEVNARILKTFSRMDITEMNRAVEEAKTDFWEIMSDNAKL